MIDQTIIDDAKPEETIKEVRELLYQVSGSALLAGEKCKKDDPKILYDIVCSANNILLSAIDEIAQLREARAGGEAVADTGSDEFLHKYGEFANSLGVNTFTSYKLKAWLEQSTPPTTKAAVREALTEFIALANKHTAHSSQDRNGEERFQNVFKVASDLIDLADKYRPLIEQEG